MAWPFVEIVSELSSKEGGILQDIPGKIRKVRISFWSTCGLLISPRGSQRLISLTCQSARHNEQTSYLLFFFFLLFSEEIRPAISCESSAAKQMIHIKYQVLFPPKIIKKKK